MTIHLRRSDPVLRLKHDHLREFPRGKAKSTPSKGREDSDKQPNKSATSSKGKQTLKVWQSQEQQKTLLIYVTLSCNYGRTRTVTTAGQRPRYTRVTLTDRSVSVTAVR